MDFMNRLFQILLLIALSVSASGCEIWWKHYDVYWREVGRETVIDPVTGDMTRTFHWEYQDGVTTTTTEVIRKGEGSERRLDVRPTPPARVLSEED
jgi:hypothetical protein